MATPDVRPCPVCGTRTMLVLTEGGNRIRVETGRVPNGTVLPVIDGDTIRARILTGAELPAEGGAYVDHRRTCGRADGPKPVKCLACWFGMDRWLVERGDRYHVNCRPLTRAEIAAALEPSPVGAVAGEGPAPTGEPTLDGGTW